MSSDVVAVWEIPYKDNVYTIELEHGTITGKRIIRVNNKEIVKKEWLFKLVGEEHFQITDIRCIVKIEPQGFFHYSYSLLVDGKSFEKFTEIQNEKYVTWIVSLPDNMYRVVLDKDSLDVWANGVKLQVQDQFVESGTEANFLLGETSATIKSITSGEKKGEIVYSLIVNDDIIQRASW